MILRHKIQLKKNDSELFKNESILTSITVPKIQLKQKLKIRSKQEQIMYKIIENRMINKFPNLMKEWDYEKNVNIDINTISFSSHEKINWICPKCTHHYLASLNKRTHKTHPTGCPNCWTKSLIIYDKDEEKLHIDNYKQTINTVAIGDATEINFYNLLVNCNKFQDVIRVGQMGGSADIIVSVNGIKKSLQVKTLTKNKTLKSYYMTNDAKYAENMLIIMADSTFSHFAIDFYKNIKVKRLTLCFDYSESKYKNIMFKNKDDLVKKIEELLPYSENYNVQSSSNNTTKEINMLNRLEAYCQKNNMTYRRNDTNGDTIDCYVNDIPVQAKYSSYTRGGVTYQVTLQKSAGSINNRVIRQNYSISDLFELLVVEVGSTENEEEKAYLNNFLFVPKQVLIEKKILCDKENNITGKKFIYVCPPNCESSHWTKQYWNKLPEKKIKIKINLK